METISALLAIRAGNSPVSGEFPAQRPVMRSFDVSFDLRLNERLSKHSWGWWLETPLLPLWRHNNGIRRVDYGSIYMSSIYAYMFVKVNARNANRARETAPIFDCEQLFLEQWKFYQMENSTSLMGIETTIPLLHAEGSNRWATGMWHFPIHGFGYWLWRYKYFCL